MGSFRLIEITAIEHNLNEEQILEISQSLSLGKV